MSEHLDVGHIRDAVDLYALAGRYTALKRWARHEWAGPCPRCGGKDRFHVHTAGEGGSQWWKCYQCHVRRGDAIEFTRWVERCDFATAVQRLSESTGIAAQEEPAKGVNNGRGGPLAHLREPAPAPAPVAAGPARDPPGVPVTSGSPGGGAAPGPSPEHSPARLPDDPRWQARAQREAAAAAQRLWRREAAAARRYLAGRGLIPYTWRAWGLGFAYAWHPRLQRRHPAITIPWRVGGKIMAIQYRFIATPRSGVEARAGRRASSDVPHGYRFSQRPGGARRVYGLDMLNTDSGARSAAPGAVLVLVEGEFNALSIWQVLHDPGPWAVPPAYHLAPVDVLSFGSESGSRARDLPEVAAGYERAVVWADRYERAAEGAALLRGHGIQAVAVSSPGGADANDLLRAGLLVEFLVLALTSGEGQ